MQCSEVNSRGAQGEHVWRYNLSLPTATATYERCQYGKIFHRLIATGHGLGLLGSDLIAQAEIEVISSPAPSGYPVPSLDLEIQDHTELGPFYLRLRSDHFTVASLLLTELTLAAPPAGLKILSINLDIDQNYIITSPKPTGPAPIENKGQRRRVYLLDARHPPSDTVSPISPPLTRNSSSPLLSTTTSDKPVLNRSPSGRRTGGGVCLAKLEEGQEWHLRHLARLPHDNSIRGSTSARTDSPIRIWHKVRSLFLLFATLLMRHAQLVLDIQFTIGNSPIRLASIERPCHLASCCCLLESLVLPEVRRKLFPE